MEYDAKQEQVSHFRTAEFREYNRRWIVQGVVYPMKTIEVERLPFEIDFLGEVERQPVLLERNGNAVGVVVSPEVFKRWQDRGDRLFAVMDRVGDRNLDKAEEEIESDIERAVEEVRAGKS